MLCDKHVVKMILESAQMLCAHFESGQAPYKRCYYNHPCTKWVRESLSNYQWLIQHAKAICNEYSYRYKKVHKSEAVIDWCSENVNKVGPIIPDQGLTAFAQAVPIRYKDSNTVTAYRTYYRNEKLSICKYTKRSWPDWLKQV